MIKIVIFSGGTGSVALQTGIAEIYGFENVQVDIIVNAYDNGKSSGACRRIFNNRILGPSDVRKNQLLQYKLKYRDKMNDAKSRESRLYHLWSTRFSAINGEHYYKKAYGEIEQCADLFESDTKIRLLNMLKFFFFEQDEKGNDILRKEILKEKFEDFSLSNIFYAASAALNDNSLETAADEMAGLLGIKSNVHLISDKNLILKAETESGEIIGGEEEIVTWDNPDDKIIRAILLEGNREYQPTVNENSTDSKHSMERILSDADIIIFSSGTQWSSLIPTYMHRGLRQMFRKSRAKKYLLMNNAEDHDALGVSADELCGILEKYLDLDEITIVLNECACSSMSHISQKYCAISGKLSNPGEKKHIPCELVKLIMTDYYGETLKCKHQFFDLDGTLWNETGSEAEKNIGRENLDMFHGVIVSGNSVAHVSEVLRNNAPLNKRIEVFADYGNTYFCSQNPEKTSFLTDKYFLDSNVLKRIKCMDIFAEKAKLRGGTVITIKPLENRDVLVDLLNRALECFGGQVVAKPAGRTSIDVTSVNYTKAVAIELILAKYQLSKSEIVFIGNELKDGSEKEIEIAGYETLSVDDVYECNTYLRTRKCLGRN